MEHIRAEALPHLLQSAKLNFIDKAVPYKRAVLFHIQDIITSNCEHKSTNHKIAHARRGPQLLRSFLVNPALMAKERACRAELQESIPPALVNIYEYILLLH